MPIYNIIAALDAHNAIGKNNQLLCYLPNDLKHFKNTTQGHPVVMGKNTYKSLPKGALPNRRNIVLTTQLDFKAPNCEIARNIDEVKLLTQNENSVFIIGGASVYQEFMDIAQKLYITHIENVFEGTDTFFPYIDLNIWQETSRQENLADESHKYNYSFVLYERR